MSNNVAVIPSYIWYEYKIVYIPLMKLHYEQFLSDATEMNAINAI